MCDILDTIVELNEKYSRGYRPKKYSYNGSMLEKCEKNDMFLFLFETGSRLVEIDLLYLLKTKS